MKLWQLLKSHLGPYRRVLTVVVVLQAIQTFAALTLPTINALLIDNGVLQGDNDYILTMGGVMLGFTVVQIVFASARSGTRRRRRWASAATSGATCSTRSPASLPARSASSVRRR